MSWTSSHVCNLKSNRNQVQLVDREAVSNAITFIISNDVKYNVD